MEGLQEPLPVALRRQEFLRVFDDHPLVILTSDMGSGKTTQIPQYILEKILQEDPESKLQIACTQPRRIAATSVAKRVASERKVALGNEVGYKIRFDKKAGEETRLLYMTDGVLRAEMMRDPNLSKYKCIIIDDAHMRSVDTDILMAKLKKIVTNGLRRDLKVVVMSATLNAAKFQEYFHDAPLFQIEGRTYPVEIKYLTKRTPNMEGAVWTLVRHIHNKLPAGDILIFVPGEREIQSLCDLMAMSEEASLRLLPLYGKLSQEQQDEAFASPKEGTRKCIVSTNIAETSLTIDGIVYVIDCGLAREPQWDPRIHMDALRLSSISKASANQRAGRAGRTKPGICFRLYTEKDFNEFETSSTPSIQCSNFAPTLLRVMATPDWKHISHVDLISLPHKDFALQAARDLYDFGYINDYQRITPDGLAAARTPIDPQWVYAIEASKGFGVQQSMILLAAIATVDKSMYWESYPHRPTLSSIYHQWTDPDSDHITQLNAFYAYLAAKKGKLNIRIWCKDHMLSLDTIKKIEDIRFQLLQHYKSSKPDKWLVEPAWGDDTPLNIRKALARGLFCNVAMRVKKGNETYRTIHDNQEVLPHPDTSVENRKFDWVVYNSVHLGARPYMTTMTGIEAQWIMNLPYFQTARMPKTYVGGLRQEAVHRALDNARKA